jgi:hypothetical protein
MLNHPLPTDIESLHRLVITQQAALLSRDVEIKKLEIALARLKRMQFGAPPSSSIKASPSWS